MRTDTIAAIATALSNAGIGKIRISGSRSFEIIDKIFDSKDKNKRISKMDSHTIHYGFIKDQDIVIDEVLVLIMRSPNSFTTEDTIEIDCHGGILVMQRILETVLKNGARLADPGEFTKRAFLAGRIDLSQAESIMDLINSKNEFSLQSAVKQLKGDIFNLVKSIRAEIIYKIAFIESFLDDPEHFTNNEFLSELKEDVIKMSYKISELLKNSLNGELLKDGIKTVIIGRPNVGKSSLLNLLLGRERAIVTDVAGTTRDAIEEELNLNGLILNIIDTAGIHDTDDMIEKIGVNKAKEYLFNSDLILYMIDGSRILSKEEENVLNLVRDKNVIYIINKIDLPLKFDLNQIRHLFSGPIIEFSAMKEVGVEQLSNSIRDLFFNGKIDYNDEIVITNLRQKEAFENTLASLNLVCDGIINGIPEDLLVIDLMDAYQELGYIIGESLNDDIVNEIFSKFCTGK